MNGNKILAILAFLLSLFLITLMQSGIITGWLFGAVLGPSLLLSIWLWKRKPPTCGK